MAYGTANVDNIQSSTTGTPVVFKDGNGTQIGTLCRAWVNFTGSTAAVVGAFNVSSITRSGAGQYVVNFTNAMPSAAYAVTVGTTNAGSNTNSANNVYGFGTTGFNFQHIEANTALDTSPICAAVFR